MKIPRNIFQTWKIKNISEKLKELTDSWITKNPNYTYYLYDDDDCEQFIKENFDERVLTAWRRIIPGAFKADLWRYCILYIYGGVYADIDTICFNSIDIFLNENTEFITPIDLNNNCNIGTYNLFNSFIASIPRHPILLECINKIVYNTENNIVPYSNLDFSGPGVLGKSTNIYLNLPEETSFIGKYGFHDEGKIHFLYFEYGSEYVKDDKQNILFQNKNGNPHIQEVYKTDVNYTNWGEHETIIKPIPK
jgi:mannosyltransferase OCH1-like enzyme